ncbi:MAG: transcription elongation factor GreA [Nitrospirae bacterium]|nr:MAG: transcription elongation factor GreA [Nitrospirota bacterium]
MQRIPFTKEGLEKLKNELDHLLKVERPKVIKAIEEARAHGDLSENAEYEAAKERQAFIETRIRELQDKIARADVIDTSRLDTSKVVFGATVRLFDALDGSEKVFKLVGPEEADVDNGRISVTSPVGRALIGKRVGDEVIVKAPGRTLEYEVLEIRFD